MKVKVPPCTIGRRHPKVLWSKINIIIMTKMTNITMTMITTTKIMRMMASKLIRKMITSTINLQKGDDSGHKENGAEYVASSRVILPVW